MSVLSCRSIIPFSAPETIVGRDRHALRFILLSELKNLLSEQLKNVSSLFRSSEDSTLVAVRQY